MTTIETTPSADKSKTLATWIAIVAGPLGLHRFYLHGFRDVLGWLHPLPTLIGLYGVNRAQSLLWPVGIRCENCGAGMGPCLPESA
jgi:hypothetical protein